MILTAVLAGVAAAALSPAEMTPIADAFDRAQLTKDAAAMDRMVDDGLIFIDGNGKRQGKTEFIAGWTGEGDRYDPIVLVDRRFTPLGSDAFMTTSETTLSGVSGGEKFASRFRFSDTFRKVGGTWRAVHIQVTRIKD